MNELATPLLNVLDIMPINYPLSARQIARRSGEDMATARRILGELIRKGYVISTAEGYRKVKDRNPGALWHFRQSDKPQPKAMSHSAYGFGWTTGRNQAHLESALRSKRLGIPNPSRRHRKSSPKIPIIPLLVVGGLALGCTVGNRSR